MDTESTIKPTLNQYMTNLNFRNNTFKSNVKNRPLNIRDIRIDRSLLSYTIFLFFTWTVMELYIFPYSDYLRPLCKIAVWILPVYIYIKVIEKCSPSSYLKLTKSIDRDGLILILLSTSILTINRLFHFFFDSPSTFDIDVLKFVNSVLLAGLTEEIVFRGFLLRKLLEDNHFLTSNFFQSFLFTLIHIPIWFQHNQNILVLIIYIFIFGLIMGCITKRSKSLWTVIIIHTLHNLLV